MFSGGGARGAYEAGVVRFIIEEMPRRLGHPIRFDIVCGTSVGAIHACYLAGTADLGPSRGMRLVDFWREMKVDEVLPFTTRDLIALPRRLLGLRRVAEAMRGGEPPDRLFGLLDTQPLERLVLRAVPWRRIRHNVSGGLLDAVCVATTELATGRVVVFLETGQRKLPGWTRDPMVVPRVTHLRPTHALASAAIPLLFPVVRIGSTYYADGGLRLNTPLSPALRLGADRVLVVALRPRPHLAEEALTSDHRVEDYASPGFLFGKVLNALMLDHLDTDLGRMRDMNELIREGREVFGDDFLERLSKATARPRDFREIEHVVIRPSSDLGLIANHIFEDFPEEIRRSPLFRLAMRNTSSGRPRAEADLVSYLLFDGRYLEPIAELGYRDAEAREEELARFFSD